MSFDPLSSIFDLGSCTDPITVTNKLHHLATLIQDGEISDEQWGSLLPRDSFSFLQQLGGLLTLFDDADVSAGVDSTSHLSKWIECVSAIAVHSNRVLPYLTMDFNLVQKITHRISECSDPVISLQRILFLQQCLLQCPPDDVLLDATVADSMCELLEMLQSDNEEVFNASVITMVLIDSVLPSQELLITYGCHHRHAAVLSEAVIRLCNLETGSDSRVRHDRTSSETELEHAPSEQRLKPLRAFLRFIGSTLRNESVSHEAICFFYHSDIQVFIDIVLREIRNLDEGSTILLDYIACLDNILSWPQYRTKLFKNHEICSVLQETLAHARPNRDESLVSLITDILMRHVDTLERKT